MKIKKIESFSRYQKIVEHYGQKGCVSNDYIQREVANLIANNSLYEYCGEKNNFLLVKKNGFWRVYFYLNDFDEILSIQGELLETEILFRNSLGEPTEVVSYLEQCGFKRHLVRDQYAGIYKDLLPASINEEIIVQPAQTLMSVQGAFDLFNQYFDKYSGDYVSPEVYERMLANESILLALHKQDDESRFLGALHQTVENNIAWVSHLAVKVSARGQHVGKALLDAFVERNMLNEMSRYMLWVQHHNPTAVYLYKTKGFKYLGKSSLSMIKYNK